MTSTHLQAYLWLYKNRLVKVPQVHRFISDPWRVRLIGIFSTGVSPFVKLFSLISMSYLA